MMNDTILSFMKTHEGFTPIYAPDGTLIGLFKDKTTGGIFEMGDFYQTFKDFTCSHTGDSLYAITE